LVGFSPLRSQLQQYCRLPSAAAMAESFAMITNPVLLKDSLDMLDECRAIVETRPSLFEWQHPLDMANMLKHIHVEGYFLMEEDLLGIAANIKIYDTFVSALYIQQDEFPHFRNLFPKNENTSGVLNSITKIIDEEAHIRLNASPTYQKVSTEINRIEREARQQTKSIFKEWKALGFTADTEVTIREERLVIPVLAEFKRKVKGFVKDVSATGKVLFMEPSAIVELNNRLKELFAERRRERERILKQLSADIRPFAPLLLQWMKSLTQADFVFAKYQLCANYDAERPQAKQQNGLVLKMAFHPVLRRELSKQNQKIVPLDLEMHDKHVVVVSGPNAGGKSVVLKTALLLQYWYQCGFFITARPESQMGHFEYLGIDCGDGQSIIAGLSTFSAHLQNLKNITEHASDRALIGLDELGTGTDPRYGAPIAQVILERLLDKKSFVIATTHFSQIREWGRTENAVLQASMAYDAVALKPLYRFIQGKPGSSFALELMRKTGFEMDWISRINDLAGKELGKTEDLMLEWERKNQQLEQTLSENLQKSAHLAAMLEEYSRLKFKIGEKRKLAMDQAKKEADLLLAEANKRIEQTIRIIQENKADKNKTSKARNELDRFKSDLNKKVEKQSATASVSSSEVPQIEVPTNWKPIPGERVKNKDTDQVGEVVELKKDRALVIFGLIKMWMPTQELVPAKPEKKQRLAQSKGFNWVERQSSFQGEMDLRGVRTEEAKAKLTSFLDEAYALGHTQVKVVHGRGDGILRKMLRDHLKSLNYVREYVNEHSDRGGDGCTIIHMN
jgi:DNA mismatch repair protein MutS2